MASVNKVILIGNLGNDPEVQYSYGGESCFGNLSIATTNRKLTNDGSYVEETEWHRVSLFGKRAEFAKKYLRKGLQVYVEGKLKTRSYEKDGKRQYITEVLADQIQILGRKADNDKIAEGSTQTNQGNFETTSPNSPKPPISDYPDDEPPF